MEKRNITACFNRITNWIVPVLAAAVILFVLYIPPRPGVADQGDFQRIMDAAGLQETEKSLAEPESRFYRYVKSEYGMISVNPFRFLTSSSMVWPIMLVKIFCKTAGLAHFNTGILTAAYAAAYISAIWMCLRWMGCKRRLVFVFACFAVLAVLLDGNYLVWFNSLYGEPMMLIGLLLFTASVLYAIRSETLGLKNILFLFITSLMFLGSKAQCITALPFVAFMHIRLYTAKNIRTCGRSNRLQLMHLPGSRKGRHERPALSAILWLAVPLALLFAYVVGIYSQQDKTCGVDTKYNAVFYGILKNSEDPEKDLEMLGLPGDLAVEAGKHAYLPPDEYVRYAPWSEMTLNEFSSKISNLKLVRFYLLNPRRLLDGMEYTAFQSFQTGTFLGKYEKADVPEYTYVFDRFTFWSDFRSKAFPKKLWFIVLAYLAAFIISAFEYRLKGRDTASRLRIELLWVIMAIGIFQFPMPFVGNGEADTAKQLFLFNITFDILIIVACIWVFSKLFFSNVEA